jgi:DNA-binding transcriptional ArsR family regulator
MDVFAALSSSVRRDILALLRDGDMSAGEIAALFSLSKPTLSAHFSVLKDAGLILAERRGNQIIYSLNLSLLEEALVGLMRRLSRNGSVAGEDKWSSDKRA